MGDTEAHCRQIIEQLFLYIDGEVAGADCARIEAHLEACRECLDHLGFEVKVKQIVRRGCSERSPSDALERLRRLVADLPEA